SLDVFRHGVVGAIDDAQVFPAPALEGGLHEALWAHGDEIERFYDDALSAATGELLPPHDCCRARGRVRKVDEAMRRGNEQGWIGRTAFRQRRQCQACVWSLCTAPSLASR